MKSKKIKPQFVKKVNPRVGLIVLATDVMIEKDFLKVFSGISADLYVNRITNFNPVTADNLKKMSNNITSVAENILPGEKIDCVVYGCTSGTIVSGYDNIKKKINQAKPDALVTAPSTAALNALKKKNINSDILFEVAASINPYKGATDFLSKLRKKFVKWVSFFFRPRFGACKSHVDALNVIPSC